MSVCDLIQALKMNVILKILMAVSPFDLIDMPAETYYTGNRIYEVIKDGIYEIEARINLMDPTLPYYRQRLIKDRYLWCILTSFRQCLGENFGKSKVTKINLRICKKENDLFLDDLCEDLEKLRKKFMDIEKEENKKPEHLRNNNLLEENLAKYTNEKKFYLEMLDKYHIPDPESQ